MIKNKNGFTLIEVLIAMTIFSASTFYIINMQINARKMTSNSMSMTNAITTAHERMEKVLTQDYDHVDLVDINEEIGIFTTYTENGVNDRYHLEWQVDDDNPSLNLKTIMLTISWKNQTHDKSISFQAVKIKPS